MLIRFSGHLKELAGKEIQMDLKRPITVGELISLLSGRYNGFFPYAEKTTDPDISAHLTIIRDGRPLRLTDHVEDSDVLDFLLPVTGG